MLGSSVLILGAGPVGLAILTSVRAAGASMVVVSEPSARRRDTAARMGAAAALDPTDSSPGRAIRELVDNDGVDLVFDTTAASGASM